MKLCDEAIKELSSIYDKESMDTFISLYFNGKDNKFIYRREKAVMAILKGEELENFIKTMEEIKKFLRKNANNIAIFASYKHDYFKVVNVPTDVKNILVVDSSPYIRPLAELADSWESFTLVLLNSNHARIFSISCDRIAEKKKLSAHIMNKHKKGGWSQARFQRLRKESIHAFFVKVMEELEKYKKKTGTTTIGLKYKDGIIIGTDSQETIGLTSFLQKFRARTAQEAFLSSEQVEGSAFRPTKLL